MSDIEKAFKKATDKATEVVKDLSNTVSDVVSKIDKDKVEELAQKSRKEVQSKMKEYGVDEKFEALKKESELIGDAISQSAKEVYKENEEILEKPVSKVSEVVEKIKEHREKIKWAGAVTAGVVAPVPTLIASSIFYLMSSEEEKDKKDILDDEINQDIDTEKASQKEVVKETAKIMAQKEKLPEVMKTENEWITVNINLKSKNAYGTINKGPFKGSSFQEMGVDNMKKLMDKLPEGVESAEEARELIRCWVSWQKTPKMNEE